MTENQLAMERLQENPVRKIAKVLYYCVVVCYCIGCFLQVLNWNYMYPGMVELGGKIREVARIIAVVLMLEQFNRSVKKGIVALLIVLLYVLYNIFMGYWGPTDLVFFYFLSDLAEERSMKKTLLLLYACLAVAVFFFGLNGVVKDNPKYFSYRTGHTLGFGHPNSLGAFVFTLVVLLRVTVLQKNKWLFTAVSLGAAAFTWFYPASRTPMVLLILYPVVIFVLDFFKKKEYHRMIRLFDLLPVAMALFSILLSLYIASNGNPVAGVDGNAMARFNNPAAVIKASGITIFGQTVNPSIPYDNSYLLVFLQHGVFWSVLLVGFFTFVMHRFVMQEHTEYIAIFALFMIQGIMENTMLVPFYSILPFFALSVGAKPEKEPAINRIRVLRIALSAVVAVSCLVGGLLIKDPKLTDIKYENVTYSYVIPSEPITESTIFCAQSITVSKPLRAFRMYTVTGGTQPTGEYRVSLLDENFNELESKDVSGSAIRDWGMLETTFDKAYPAGKYIIQFIGKKIDDDSVMIFMNDTNPYPDGAAYIDGVPSDCDWVFECAYQKEDNVTLYRGVIGVLGLMLIGLVWFL